MSDAMNVAAPDPALIIAEIYPSLLRLARSIGGADAASDLAQQALVEVLAQRPRFAGIDNPLAYSRVVLTRVAFSTLGRRRAEIPTTATLESMSDPLPDGSADVLDKMVVAQALSHLGQRQRACIVLSRIYQLPDREVAEILDCSPSTVRSQIARGLKAMRSSLAGTDAEAIFESEGR